jgi:hypothetical protein
MFVVFGLAVALGLGIPAFLAFKDDDRHFHSFIVDEPSETPYLHGSSTPTPFLSRFWRHLSGQRRPEGRDCGAWTWRIEDVCVLGHPEILEPQGNGTFTLKITPTQLAEFGRRAQAQANGR